MVANDHLESPTREQWQVIIVGKHVHERRIDNDARSLCPQFRVEGHMLTYFWLAVWRETIFCLHKQVAAVNRESAKRALHSDGRMVLGDSDPLRTHRDF